jgi:imidazolonepropionase
MKKIFLNIKGLLQVLENSEEIILGHDMKNLNKINDAYLIIDNDLIIDYGPMNKCPAFNNMETINANNCFLLPAWCDSHTHLVYAGNREKEFFQRISGDSYQTIAKKGGGILNSAKKLQQTSTEELYNQSSTRLEEIIKLGTGAIEIKSGYGLEIEAEIKMLKVIKLLKRNYGVSIKSTFLAAHAIPEEYKKNRNDFVEKIVDYWIPRVAEEKLANYIDVFCEKNYFSILETRKILECGIKYNLTPKIHVNQFNQLGGVSLGVELGALSVDHLEIMKEEDFSALKGSKTIAVSLPNCSFFLEIPFTPARKIIDENIPLALASDYNPGSAPSGNMNFVISLACNKMKMTPEEAINASTINGAYAMGLADKLGSITRGKKANLILTKPISSYAMLPYSFGNNLIEKVYINGKEL